GGEAYGPKQGGRREDARRDHGRDQGRGSSGGARVVAGVRDLREAQAQQAGGPQPEEARDRRAGPGARRPFVRAGRGLQAGRRYQAPAVVWPGETRIEEAVGAVASVKAGASGVAGFRSDRWPEGKGGRR